MVRKKAIISNKADSSYSEDILRRPELQHCLYLVQFKNHMEEHSSLIVLYLQDDFQRFQQLLPLGLRDPMEKVQVWSQRNKAAEYYTTVTTAPPRHGSKQKAPKSMVLVPVRTTGQSTTQGQECTAVNGTLFLFFTKNKRNSGNAYVVP